MVYCRVFVVLRLCLLTDMLVSLVDPWDETPSSTEAYDTPDRIMTVASFKLCNAPIASWATSQVDLR
jgi:hypothetical protein